MANEARRPNFLIFCTDQQRADHMGCAGNPVVQTPSLDRLAAEGVLCARAYVNNPLCMPSRATMLTGQTARGHGVRSNGIPLRADAPTMTAALVEAGYRTHSVGKIHVNDFGTPRGVDPATLNPADWPEAHAMWESGRITHLPRPYYGFQTAELTIGHATGVRGDYRNWLAREHADVLAAGLDKAGTRPDSGAEQCMKSDLPEALHHSRWVADRTIDFLRNGARAERPFFVWCSFPDPHHGYTPPHPWADMYDGLDLRPAHRREGELDRLPSFYRAAWETGIQLAGRGKAPARQTDAQLRDIIALTYSMVSLLDHHVGRVVTAVEELGLRDDTVIAFVCDHGDMMGDHWMLNKGPFHFEGLLRVPMIWSWPGRFLQGVTTQALASLLDLVPTVLDLAGVEPPEGPTPPQPEAPDQCPALPGKSLTPLLRGDAAGVQDSVVIENDEDYLPLRLRTLVTDRHKITVYAGQDFGELFDLVDDPHEVTNLWDHPASQPLKADLKARLLHRLIETDSPLPRRLTHA